MEPSTPSFSDWLSNLSVWQILWGVAALTAVRLISVRLLTKAGRAPSKGLGRAAVEIADSLIYAFAIAFLLIKPLVAQPFYVPTGSMEPTIRGDNQTNDRVWVDKIGYRLHPPRRGDVVVFIPPARATAGDGLDKSGPIHYIKRLIGEGGDRIQVTAGKLVINGMMWSHADVRGQLARAGFFGEDPLDDSRQFMAVDHVKFTQNGIYANKTFIDKQQIAELFTGSAQADVEIVPGHVILNGRILNEPYVAEDPDYDLKIVNGEPLKHDYGRGVYEYDGTAIDPTEYEKLAANPPGAIPKGTYFMMGDNRNDSQDSTEWGPLTASRVVGRADAIFWPINRVNLEL